MQIVPDRQKDLDILLSQSVLLGIAHRPSAHCNKEPGIFSRIDLVIVSETSAIDLLRINVLRRFKVLILNAL